LERLIKNARFALGIVLVGLVLTELAVRATAARLPPVLEWPDWETQNKIEAIDRLAARGGASIVTVGSSVVNAGFDPTVMTRMMGDGRPAFNGALNASNAPLTELWTLRVVVPRLHPRMVIIGTNANELNGPDTVDRRFYNLLVHSRGWRKVIGGGSLYERADDLAARWSYLIRYRAALRQPTSFFHPLRDKRDQAVGPLGAIRTNPHGARARNPFRSDTLGGSAIGRRRLAALGRLADTLRAQGIDVVVVRMPSVEEIGIAKSTPGYARFEKTLGAFIAAHPVRYFDMRPLFTDVHDFADNHHLNQQGKLRMSQLVADKLRTRSAA
jgi:hypothetical protein